MAVLIPTEAEEAQTLVAYLRVKGYKFHHSPNETGSSFEARRRAVRMKREGTSRGFPDYCIIVGKQPVFVELKRLKGSKIAPEQVEWVKALRDAGVVAEICCGAHEAIELIEAVKRQGIGDVD